eukprot:scaffold8691_cov106-Isochrysis_galbana.AAC.2
MRSTCEQGGVQLEGPPEASAQTKVLHWGVVVHLKNQRPWLGPCFLTWKMMHGRPWTVQRGAARSDGAGSAGALRTSWSSHLKVLHRGCSAQQKYHRKWLLPFSSHWRRAHFSRWPSQSTASVRGGAAPPLICCRSAGCCPGGLHAAAIEAVAESKAARHVASSKSSK